MWTKSKDESLGQLMMAICLTSTRLSLRNAQRSMEPARPRAANHCAHPPVIRSPSFGMLARESSRLKWNSSLFARLADKSSIENRESDKTVYELQITNHATH